MSELYRCDGCKTVAETITVGWVRVYPMPTMFSSTSGPTPHDTHFCPDCWKTMRDKVNRDPAF